MARETVTLYTTSRVGNDVNKKALDELGAIGLDVALERCPESVSDWYRCPFLKDSAGESYFGIDGIMFFVRRQRERGAVAG